MKDEAKHTELIDLAIKKHTQEANDVELRRLEELLAEDPEYQQAYDAYVKTWNLTENAHGITREEIDAEWKRLDRALDGTSKPKSEVQYIRLAAVIALLILGTSFIYQYIFGEVEIETIAVELTSQEMNDGSVITLNSGSKLRYTDTYNNARREVQLEGEAFFDVARDEEKPFIVKARDTRIEVLGTSFHVTAGQSDNSTEVVVVTGKVQVAHGDNQIVLLPGEKAVADHKSGKLFKLVNDDPNFQAWRTKAFTFADMPLTQVIALLGEVYDTRIYLANKNLGSCPVTVSFENQTLESILEVLTSTLDLTTNQTDKGLAIDGEGCE